MEYVVKVGDTLTCAVVMVLVCYGRNKISQAMVTQARLTNSVVVTQEMLNEDCSLATYRDTTKTVRPRHFNINALGPSMDARDVSGSSMSNLLGLTDEKEKFCERVALLTNRPLSWERFRGILALDELPSERNIAAEILGPGVSVPVAPAVAATKAAAAVAAEAAKRAAEAAATAAAASAAEAAAAAREAEEKKWQKWSSWIQCLWKILLTCHDRGLSTSKPYQCPTQYLPSEQRLDEGKFNRLSLAEQIALAKRAEQILSAWFVKLRASWAEFRKTSWPGYPDLPEYGSPAKQWESLREKMEFVEAAAWEEENLL